MDIQPQNQQSISDDQELAKVLAGVNQQSDAGMPDGQTDEATLDNFGGFEAPEVAQEAAPEAAPYVQPIAVVVPSNLESIKQEALGELRPLVDKLDVSAEEKFDTYLLLLRSTDDQNLIAPAHEAARGIADEARRAQALLDIIKEIDYLSGAAQQPAA